MNMIVRNVIAGIVLAMVIAALMLVFNAAVKADDFLLRLTINGDDISAMDTVPIDPDGEFVLDLRIFDNTSDVILHRLSVEVTLAGITIMTINEPLGNHRIVPGEEYRREIPVNAGEFLKLGSTTITIGKYRSQFKLEYTAGNREGVWNRWVNIQIIGNPLLTPVGGAGVVISALTFGAILWLVKGLSSLYHLAWGRLESLARGRVVGSIVNAARKRVIREKCPVCGQPFKNNYCFNCGKSVKEVSREYRDRLKELAQRGEKLLADGRAKHDEICSKLGIDGQLGVDVMAVIRDARLFRLQGMARKLMIRAVFTGIGMVISTILWVTVGGFAVLSSTALLAILIAAIVIPLAVTWGLRFKAKRALLKSVI